MTMATIKSYTDLQQSKKLAKILSIESADMTYIGSELIPYPYCESKFKGEDNVYPAWSLAALIDVLPDEVGDNHYLTLDKEGNEYCCCYEDINGNSFKHTFADNPVDTCVEMIIKLHEKNLL